MSDAKERERRAIAALIVSRIRALSSDDACSDSIPDLTPEEEAQLNCLRQGFIESVIAKADAGHTAVCQSDVPDVESGVDEELVYGLNRAEEDTSQTDEELKRNREQML